MPTSIAFNPFGFFNGQMPLNQTNWAAYFSPTIPDGVIAGIGDEMEVYGNSTGMTVYVKTGECRVRSHRGVLSTVSSLDIEAADATYDRYDLVVARVTYESPSTMEVTVKTGTANATPEIPEVTQTAGDVWEIPLAVVTVGAGVQTIADTDVTDKRFVYANEGMAPITFSGETLSVENYRYYRNETQISGLEITLPDSPSDIWKCSVDFYASSSFSGVTFVKGGETPTILTDDDLALQSTRYHLDILWMGAYYWIIAHTADGKPIKTFSGTTLTADSHREYRNSTAIGSLQITVPQTPEDDYITVVCFSSSASFTGVTFKRGTSSLTPKQKGDLLTLKSKRYNLAIWWDGANYWVNSEAA